MHQGKLFYESAMHAVECAITDSPYSYEEVAHHLWPSKKLATAYARLKACLHDEKDEKFSFEEIIELCNFCGRHDPLYHFAAETHHERPKPRTPEDARDELKREFIQTGKRMETIWAQLQRLEEKQ